MILNKLYKNLIITKPKFTLSILLILLLSFGYYSKDFQLDASSDTLLLENDPDLNLLETIRKYNDQAEIIRCVHKPKFFREVNGEIEKGLSFLYESFVGVFCGIASPRGFEQIIDRMSGELRFRRRFLDHHRYEAEELDLSLIHI